MIGFGTWQITGQECEEAVKDAVVAGYRHIDTAQAYQNELEIGKVPKMAKDLNPEIKTRLVTGITVVTVQI
jgi:diketogulonate reductase-like aldo/keto reductase